MKNKTIFCTVEQLETDHKITIDQNGEFLFTCPCGHFFKLPGDATKEDIATLLEAHKTENEGRVSAEALEQENLKKLNLIDET